MKHFGFSYFTILVEAIDFAFQSYFQLSFCPYIAIIYLFYTVCCIQRITQFELSLVILRFFVNGCLFFPSK